MSVGSRCHERPNHQSGGTLDGLGDIRAEWGTAFDETQRVTGEGAARVIGKRIFHEVLDAVIVRVAIGSAGNVVGGGP